jgi:hypothetical protein
MSGTAARPPERDDSRRFILCDTLRPGSSKAVQGAPRKASEVSLYYTIPGMKMQGL